MRPRRRYEVVNRTRWSTRDLRAFVVACAKRVFADDEKRGVAIKVEFRVARTSRIVGGVHGRAVIGGRSSWIWIRQPDGRSGPFGPDRLERDAPPKRHLASVMCHEFAHNAGMSNERRMRASTLYGSKR